MVGTEGCQTREGELIPEKRSYPDRSLQLDCVKLESLVIAEKIACRGEYVPGSVHTARHTMGVGFTRSS